jgi:hypothetical protein
MTGAYFTCFMRKAKPKTRAAGKMEARSQESAPVTGF